VHSHPRHARFRDVCQPNGALLMPLRKPVQPRSDGGTKEQGLLRMAQVTSAHPRRRWSLCADGFIASAHFLQLPCFRRKPKRSGRPESGASSSKGSWTKFARCAARLKALSKKPSWKPSCAR
jgi:hypothetical protein